MTVYIENEYTGPDFEEMFSSLNTAIHQFSKRQMTWFRRMERLSFDIHWIDVALSEDEKMAEIYKVLNR